MTVHAGRIAVLSAALLASGAVAGAADPTPTFNGCGKFAKDPATDASDPSTQSLAEAELENAWVQYDAAKGAEGVTVNMTVKNLTGTAPPPATSITYDSLYEITAGVTNFVRAHIDFTGMPVFEYGHTEELANGSSRYAYDGTTKGTLFKGEHGVVQLVLPPAAGGKPGTAIKGMLAETQVGRTTAVPGAVTQSPTRGLSFQNDEVGLGSYTVTACAPGSAPAAPGAGAPSAPPATGGAGPPAPPSSQQTAGPLPVTLASRSVKAAKKGKTVKLKLKSSEPVRDLGARISKGRKAFGTGKLAALNGAGTLKVKLGAALKKGTYVLDLAGTDGQGRRRLATVKLKVVK